ncbi:cytochrome P450 [Pseudovirgaria hyperparasitica]|uniref:Cytochrome P450 n=1 Tax=Pseudovirgaria hyperparasitica TaxID=470096 RepID=A0A6A6VW69_9PEZI|nr:cytochrome P450 [Pseudovirgaria hyperparasitica]KAF2754938.1 cytochrome P450 [Pseudovirgaria hyperparasitica]
MVLIPQSLLLCVIPFAIVVFIVQRRVFHPLSKYPGPWLNSLSEIPAAVALAAGRQHAYYRKLHSKYGAIVRVGPSELSFVNSDAWKNIYDRGGNSNMEKHPVFIGAVPKVQGSVGLTMAPLATKDHSRHRRALGHSFTTGALLNQQEIILGQVQKLMQVMKDYAAKGEHPNMLHWFTYTTFDIMGELTFGETFGCLDKKADTDWSLAIINVFVSGAWEQAIRRLTGVDTYAESIFKKLLLPKSAALWRRLHFEKAKVATEKRIKDGDRDHKDLMYFVLKSKEARQDLSDMELMINMVLLVSAGSETTASTLTPWAYFINADRHVYSRVVGEIRGKFKRVEDIRWANLQPDNLPYLHATINETLRLVPAAAVSQQRVVPIGGAVICGESIPKGCTVAVPSFAITHMEFNFARPNEFCPQRWLSRDHPDWDDQFAGDNLAASQPFSVGPRACIGKQLAYFELCLILANFIWNFDSELADPKESNRLWSTEDDMRCMKSYLSWTKPALPLKLREVKRDA